ncbi:biotin-dependent carboxyltransferase family protein [Devosia albogilva]|uniref:Biotin-dependent carboxyltransferase family protein n=1 Tax=Devosia albogilva TaxID=429726 RepID=A0ABW5QG08_9HYPH
MLRIVRASPLTTVQDAGRFGALAHGIAASGPMDRRGYEAAGLLAGAGAGGVEFTRAGIEIELVAGRCRVGFAGGDFTAAQGGARVGWPGLVELSAGDRFSVTPGAWGNYGYLRFGGDIDVPLVMGSMATNSRAGLGGLAGRALVAGDEIRIAGKGKPAVTVLPADAPEEGPIRVVWGLHADRFSPAVRERFVASAFRVSMRLDRMGVRLEDTEGVFAATRMLGLVSDAVVPGDIQILGDGAPIVLMRDHQPTGGYPRIGTVISADLDRLAQMRPGTAIAFQPVTVEHAQQLLRSQAG